ncbi:MAG TPA: FAD-dependent oxidoreductase, partial [Pseudonocardiaceae bacterium]|nr:FAD-dependent oxidoreductase [Pseudonocardiaceae bacterium]
MSQSAGSPGPSDDLTTGKETIGDSSHCGLGAGYAGLAAANRIAERAQHAQVTLVNARAQFVERVRLHQVAAGQQVREYPLRERLRGTGIQLVVGRVQELDLGRRQVLLDSATETAAVDYDTLVYALGSAADTSHVAEHAYPVADLDSARELGKRVPDLATENGVLAVVGGGLTGIETATELAESYPQLRVRLVTAGQPGGWLSARGREHLQRVFDRLGIEVWPDATVTKVGPDGVVLADGATIDAGLTVWATGFVAPVLARQAGLAVDANGRILVDDTLRSRSHPEIYAVGDSAAAHRAGGQLLRMSCAAGLPTGRCAAAAITARLAGRQPRPLRFRYVIQCISLGRRDGLIQFVHPDDTPHETVVTGRA